MDSEAQQIISCIKQLTVRLNEAKTFSEFLSLKEEMDKHDSALAVLLRPELKGKMCPLCHCSYDGYGNNPAPLKVKEPVCNECNTTKVIPARLGRLFQE